MGPMAVTRGFTLNPRGTERPRAEVEEEQIPYILEHVAGVSSLSDKIISYNILYDILLDFIIND